jgi:hypothetical protein
VRRFFAAVNRPVYALLLIAAGGSLAVRTLAQESAPAPPAGSSHASEMIVRAARQLTAKSQPPTSASPTIPRVEADRPANDIVRLPSYIVRERPMKLPEREEVMSEPDLARIGMNRYIGLEDGFDRGFLNRFTIKSVWNKIPVLGKYPLLGFETNEERGLRLYREAKKKEELESLMGLLSPALRADAPGPKPAEKK